MAWIQRDSSTEYQVLPFLGVIALCGVLGGCGTLGGSSPSATTSPLKVVVGPVKLEAPITKSTQIHSYEEDPPEEIEPILLAQLKEEIEIKAQRSLTEHLARQNGLIVVPFDETRPLLAELVTPGVPLTEDQVRALGDQTGSDVVVTGRIHDYGKVRWQYWVTGWFLHVSAWTTAIGIATAWNPAAVGAFLLVDATTDFPIWYGGAEIFGWAFRHVRVHLDATQLLPCQGLIWTDDELAVKVPGKALAEYPPEDQGKKEIQLEVNLNQAMADLAKTVGEKLKLQPCTEDGKPEQISGFSFFSLFDFLIP